MLQTRMCHFSIFIYSRRGTRYVTIYASSLQFYSAKNVRPDHLLRDTQYIIWTEKVYFHLFMITDFCIFVCLTKYCFAKTINFSSNIFAKQEFCDRWLRICFRCFNRRKILPWWRKRKWIGWHHNFFIIINCLFVEKVVLVTVTGRKDVILFPFMLLPRSSFCCESWPSRPCRFRSNSFFAATFLSCF